jgi:hypothetical protein
MHGALGHLIADDELVFWGTSGAVGVADDGAIGSQRGFVAADGMLDQRSGTEIEMRPAFAQQLGNVADVQGGSHSRSPGAQGLTQNALFCLKHATLAKERDHSSSMCFRGTIL